MRAQKEIARWLKATALYMYNNDEEGCASLFVQGWDHELSLSVGWIDGYDPSDAGKDFHSRGNPTWCLNACIVKYNPADCADLMFMNMPYDPVTGDVYDTQNTLGSDTDWNKLAKWYIAEYRNIRKELNKGTLV